MIAGNFEGCNQTFHPMVFFLFPFRYRHMLFLITVSSCRYGRNSSTHNVCLAFKTAACDFVMILPLFVSRATQRIVKNVSYCKNLPKNSVKG